MEKNNTIFELIKKIKHHEDQTELYLIEIKKLLSNTQHVPHMISYFTYSINISHNISTESMIIGTFHIRNIGKNDITHPYICIKLSPDAPIHFSGKYVNKKNSLSSNPNGAWERINEQTNKNEYWLKPIGTVTIGPSETITFSNFQIKWKPEKSYNASVSGFSYCDEIQNGIPAVNQIYISGSFYE
ncbi:hypothetical protein [Metabacillus halosaccharovorans]|uniref:hypothetical protein n=1 Tax=Metabacillus halosaccharovorans TaxID=930124 RepID=UPI003734ED6F